MRVFGFLMRGLFVKIVIVRNTDHGFPGGSGTVTSSAATICHFPSRLVCEAQPEASTQRRLAVIMRFIINEKRSHLVPRVFDCSRATHPALAGATGSADSSCERLQPR